MHPATHWKMLILKSHPETRLVTFSSLAHIGGLTVIAIEAGELHLRPEFVSGSDPQAF